MAIDQDIAALDWATKNPSDPRASAITQKLGVGQRDLEAWNFAKANANDPKAGQVVERLVTKIASKGADQGPPSMGESAFRGGAQFLSGGFVDEVAGGLEAAGSLLGLRGLGGGFNEIRMERPDEKGQSLGQVYEGKRNERRFKDEAAFAENPGSYLGGGLVAMSLVPGGAVLGSSKLIPSLGKSAVMGGITAAGTTEANPLENPGQFAADVGKGMAWGVGGDLVGRGIGAGLSKLKPENLRQTANIKANKAAGAMTKELRDLGPEGVQERGKFLLEKKIVTASAALDDVADRAGALKADAGKAIGKAIDDVDGLVKEAKKLVDQGKIGGALPPQGRKALKDSIDKQFQFNMGKIADEIETQLIGPNVKNSFLRNEVKKLAGLVEDLRAQGIVSLAEGNIIKGTQYAKTRFASDTIPEAFKKQIGRIVKEQLDDVIAKTGNLEGAVERARGGVTENLLGKGSPLIPRVDVEARNKSAAAAYQAAKKVYGASKSTQDMAVKSMGRTGANRAISLTDTIMGAGGLATGALVTGGSLSGAAALGAAAGALNKLARRYGNGVMAVSANKAAEKLEKSPEVLGKFAQVLIEATQRGGAAVASAHVALMKDPEYRKLLETHAEK